MEHRIKSISIACMAIGILACVIFILAPAVYTTIISTQTYRPALGIGLSESVGFANFRTLFDSPFFPRQLGNSFIFHLGSIVLALVFAIPAAIMVGGMEKGKARSMATIALLIPAFVPDITLAMIAMSQLSVQTLTNPGQFRLLMIVLGAIRPTAIAAFVGACGAGLYQNKGKAATRGAIAGVFFGLAATLVQFLSSNMELHVMLASPSVLATADTLDFAIYRTALIQFQFSTAAATWATKTVFQVLIAITIAGFGFLVIRFSELSLDDGITTPTTDRYGHENSAKLIPGVLAILIFLGFVIAFLATATPMEEAPVITSLGRGVANSVITTLFAGVVFAVFAFTFSTGASMLLHKIWVLTLLLVMVAITGNILGIFLSTQASGFFNTLVPPIFFTGINVTFILPIAYLARLRSTGDVDLKGLFRNLVPYLIAFVGLVMASAWGGYFIPTIMLHSPSTFSIPLILRHEPTSGWGVILWQIIPIVVIALATMIAFVVSDKNTPPKNEGGFTHDTQE